MTRLDKITAATRGKHDPSPRGIPGACSGEAPASPCMTPGTSPSLVNEASALNDGWGNQPRCIECRKGLSNCFCDDPDIEDMPAADISRIMGWDKHSFLAGIVTVDSNGVARVAY